MDEEVVIYDLDSPPDWANEDQEDEKPVGPEDDPNTATEGLE